MIGPVIIDAAVDRLDGLSKKASSFAASSPKLGRIAGLSVVVLKPCALIPLVFIQLILDLGVLLANLGGAPFSKTCQEDLNEYLSLLKKGALNTPHIPGKLAKLFLNGVKGVWKDPEAERLIENDIK